MKTKHTISKIRKTAGIRYFSMLFVALLAASLSSCNNDDDNAPASEPVPTTRDYLTSGKWYMQSATYLVTNDCERQQYFLYNADNSLTIKQVGTEDEICVDRPLLTGTYELSESNILTMTLGTNTLVLKILSINKDLMVVETILAGNPENIIFDKIEG